MTTKAGHRQDLQAPRAAEYLDKDCHYGCPGSAAASQELSDQAELLDKLVGRFQVDGDSLQ